MRTVHCFAVLALGLVGCAVANDSGSEPVASARHRLAATELSPPSTLLSPGSTSVEFSMRTDAPSACRYSVGSDAGYEAMKPFATGDGTTEHGAKFEGLSPDPMKVNGVFVRCDADPAFLLELQYRSLSKPTASYPRVGNLWGWWGLYSQGAAKAARIDLYLGASPKKEEIVELRKLNPGILVLTSINTVEEPAPEITGLPESYYLKDTAGKPIEVWPGAFRVNITRPEVARFKAQEAYRTIEETGFMADGCFFDNFLLMPSWLTKDMWGNPVQVDADEDGVADDPKTVDAAWRQGAIAELQEFRRLMPQAYVSGHAVFLDAEVGPLFNGEGIGFLSSDVIEGEAGFPALWKRYQDWWKLGRAPVITMLESSARDDIAYGFSYEPHEVYPASTLEFARTYYPDMRFGLAFTLLGDGFFSHEIGDTWHGNDWWYDELDYDLGEPCGPASRVDFGGTPTTNLIDNGGFEQALDGTWGTWVNEEAGASATIEVDGEGAKEGSSSVRIDVTSAGEGTSWHIALMQSNRPLEKGKLYDLVFWARADSAHQVYVHAQKGSADWDDYGLSQSFELTQEWAQYTASLESKATATDARVSFNVGTSPGKVWIDDVKLVAHPPDVMQREFTKGKAILNATREWRSVEAGEGFSRLQGAQAPRVQYLIDDLPPAFTADSGWSLAQYDSKEWTAVGPFFHDWGPSMHRLDGAGGAAEWVIDVRGDDTYTLQAWWPGGPDAAGFSNRAVYEIISGGTVIATQDLDQTAAGNEWHTIAEVKLTAGTSALVRLHNEGQGAVIADALHVYSKSRLNDGTEAGRVEIAPMDGMVLRRTGGQACVPGAAGAGGSAGEGQGGSSGEDAAAAAGSGGQQAGEPASGGSDGGGCGCRSAGRGTSAAWVLIAGVLLCRRRRSSRSPRRSVHPGISAALLGAVGLVACSSDDDASGQTPIIAQEAGDSSASPEGSVADSSAPDARTEAAADAKSDANQTDTSVPDAEKPQVPSIHFVGRHESGAPGKARFGWSGTGLVVRFHGTGVRVRMNDPAKFFTVVVDGEVRPTLATTKGSQAYTLATGLPAGDHVVQMLRQTEGFFGATSVEDVEIDGQLLAPPAVTRRIEVLGDSITCGYGNEGTDQSCDFSAETENHYLTYGAIAARAVGAELSTIAWSGKGVIYNYGDDKTQPLPSLYERTLASEDGAWSFAWKPDVVLVNLGTNDVSTDDDPGKAQFVGAYVALLEKLRSKNPGALILCTVAPLLSAGDTATVQGYIDAAVAQRAGGGDTRVKRIDLMVKAEGWGCDWHPSAKTHEAMASKLVGVLKSELGW